MSEKAAELARHQRVGSWYCTCSPNPDDPGAYLPLEGTFEEHLADVVAGMAGEGL